MASKYTKKLILVAGGDIILGPDTDSFFRSIRPVLQSADILVGHLEVPFTSRDPNAVKLGRQPENMSILSEIGFDVLTLAHNHILDAGVQGIEDTIAWLQEHHINHVGAGTNIREARKPVIIDRDGTRFGFLSYNCVGPKETWATAERPGCAYVNILTHYELDYAAPGGPPDIYTFPQPQSLKAMEADIEKLRPLCDVLLVSLHKGLVHMPIVLAQYEQTVSYAAIDAGADLIMGHHAHILKGIEIYKGKVIFHGLGNFVTWLPLLSLKPGQDPNSWARRRIRIFGFKPDPEYPTYPFHPDAKYTLIAKFAIENRAISRVSYIPCLVNKQGYPEILRNDKKGQEVFDYVEKITKEAELNGRFEWDENEIMISTSTYPQK
jgi:hypothetical protein